MTFFSWINALWPGRRRTRQAALLSLLATATEKGLPLTPTIDAFADDTRGGYGPLVRDLADILQSGESLAVALEAVPGVLPPETVLAIRVGAESGALGPALRSAARDLSAQRPQYGAWSMGQAILYVAFVFSVLVHVVTFQMYYIVPKFKAIFADFGVELPVLTSGIIATSAFVSQFFFLLVFPLVTGGAAAAVMIFALSRRRVPLTGPLCFPHRVLPRLGTPGILRGLSVVVAAERPLAEGLSTTVGFHPNHRVRQRIATVADDVAAGNEPWGAFENAKLLTHRQAALLSAGERVGNLPWALGTLADEIDARRTHRLQLLLEMVRPVVVLALGVLVGLFSIGMFLPLVHLLIANSP